MSCVFCLLGHFVVHQAGSGARFVPSGGSGIAQGLHCRVEEVLHAVRISANAFWTVGDGAAR